MEFIDIVMQRHAAKKFNGKKIEDAKIEKLVEMIRFAPSSFNIQPWKVKIVTEPQLKEALQAAAWNQPQVTSCSHFLVFCADQDVLKLADKLENLMLESGTPEEKVSFFLNMTRGFLERLTDDEKLAWAQKQTYIALSNAMNGATALGLDSCPMEGIDINKFTKILGIEPPLFVTVGLAVGYAEGEAKRKLRFPVEEIIF